MQRLQIGMWYGLDLNAWETYGCGKITGLEVSQYQNEEEMEALVGFCGRTSLSFGIHAPIWNNQDYTLPKATSLVSSERDVALLAIKEQVEAASRYGADYILLHYPFPPIFPTLTDPFYFAGIPQFEHYWTRQIKEDELKEASVRLFDTLSELQLKYRQRIVLEHDFFGDYEDLVTSMFAEYKDIQLVVDTQRMDVHRGVFPEFDPYRWLGKAAPYVYLVHYSNTRYEAGKFHRHLPVLEWHLSDPNHGDSYDYLTYLAQRNNRFHVTFEHDPKLVTPDELHSCYNLVYMLLNLPATCPTTE